MSGFNRKENPSKNKCTKKCPSNENINENDLNYKKYIYDENTYRCYLCNETCKDCTNPPNKEDNYCTSCKNGFDLLTPENININYNVTINSCWEECPNYYGSQNDGVCFFCGRNGLISYKGNCYEDSTISQESFLERRIRNLFCA